MEGNFYHFGIPNRVRHEKLRNLSKTNADYDVNNRYTRDNADDDLIIEDNTIYEIDRECFERLKRQRRKKD